MSKKYTPTNWVANKTVATADVMNNIEQGVVDAHQDIEILDSQVKDKANEDDVNSRLGNDNNVGERMIAPFFDSNNGTLTYLYESFDGKTFDRISDIPLGSIRDGDIIFYKDKYYMLATQILGSSISDFRLFESYNLKDWEEYRIDVGLREGSNDRVWAPEWFCDDNGDLYITISKMVGMMTDSNKEYHDMRPYIIPVTNLEQREFGTPRELILNGDNKIDGHIIKKGDTYHLFIKKERNEGIFKDGEIQLWTSKDLTNWTLVTQSLNNFEGKNEAPCVEFIDNKYFIYVDNYGGDLGSFMQYSTSSDLINWQPLKPINCSYPTRHGTVRKIKELKAVNIISNTTRNVKKSKEFFNNCWEVHTNTSMVQNKYLEIFTLDNTNVYKSTSVYFTLSDVQNNFLNARFLLMVKKGGEQSTPVVSLKLLDSAISFDYLNRVKCIQDGFITRVIFDVKDTKNCSLTITFDSVLSKTYILEPSNMVYDSMPKGDEILPVLGSTLLVTSNLNSLKSNVKPSKYYDIGNVTSTQIKFKTNNGIVQILGNSNGTYLSNIIDTKIICLNGRIGVHNPNNPNEPVLATLDSYSNRTYTITLTLPTTYSVFEVVLPVNGEFVD